MKTFEEFRFSIPHNKVKLEHKYTYAPTTTEELMVAIKTEIKLQGPNADLNCIDTSKITNMSGLFNTGYNKYAKDFNGDISGWDVSNVKNMDSMFCYAVNFNGDISSWDVSNVNNMYCMFYCARNFNSDISSWDVSNVENMSSMFLGAKNFNGDISGWNVGNVKNMSYMFQHAESFNQDISKWDVSKVKYMYGVFENCPIKEEYKPKFK